MSEVRLAKVESIQRAIARARHERAAAGSGFAEAVTHQDAAILNVLRACESAIDLANLVVRERRAGVPQSNRDSFRLLERAGLIDLALSTQLQKMVGFRNIAVHRYRDLTPAILEQVIDHSLDDLLRFADVVARQPELPG